MLYLSWVLFWFEVSLGLKINLDKSDSITIGEVANVSVLAVELGCRTGNLPSTYLGLPLGANHKMQFRIALRNGCIEGLLYGSVTIFLKEGG